MIMYLLKDKNNITKAVFENIVRANLAISILGDEYILETITLNLIPDELIPEDYIDTTVIISWVGCGPDTSKYDEINKYLYESYIDHNIIRDGAHETEYFFPQPNDALKFKLTFGG